MRLEERGGVGRGEVSVGIWVGVLGGMDGVDVGFVDWPPE